MKITGFELRSSVVRSDPSANCATTTNPLLAKSEAITKEYF